MEKPRTRAQPTFGEPAGQIFMARIYRWPLNTVQYRTAGPAGAAQYLFMFFCLTFALVICNRSLI
jgi:hypothetical protein